MGLREVIRKQLTQGVTPRQLALTCSVAGGISICPILGVTTTLCLIAGWALRLNQPLLQAVNYLLYPAQIAMIPIFLKAGQWAFRSSVGIPISINPVEWVHEFRVSPQGFFVRYGWALAQGAAVWVVVAPLLSFISYWVLGRAFEHLAMRLAARSSKR